MSKKSNYITTNRSKHYLKIHLIFVCKYRKPLLIGNLNEDMKTILDPYGKILGLSATLSGLFMIYSTII
jgi:hypothetical protein